MDAPTTTVCTNCKPTTKPIPPLETCRTSYDAMQSCMQEFGGSISACKLEWSAFRKCYEGADPGANVGAVKKH